MVVHDGDSNQQREVFAPTLFAPISSNHFSPCLHEYPLLAARTVILFHATIRPMDSSQKEAPNPTMTSCVTSTMMSPVPSTNSATSYPTPRTQSTAHMLTALKSHSKRSLRNEISPASGVASLTPRPSSGSKQYTFTEEEDQVEDKALVFLQRTGHLAQVAGSQSMLSQELLAEGEELESQCASSSQMSSISTKTPKAIARRYGILTQEMEEEEDNPRAANEKSDNSYLTPPRKKVARKIVTATQDSKEIKKDSKNESQLSNTQPSLTMSQLEEAADGPPLFAYTQSGLSVPNVSMPNVYRKRASSSSLISLCTAAEKKINEEAKQTEERTKRKINRKLPTTCNSTASGQPPMKKAKADKSTTSSVARAGDSFDPNEPMAGEIQWVGRSTKSLVVNDGTQDAATQAAAMAYRIMQGDDELSKRLLLGMALNRDSPRQGPPEWPEKGPIPEGFVWAHYPPLEGLLKENMEEYYNLSMAKCQSSKQQLFNNNLVDRVRDLASKYEWTFPTDRRTLRDRIRCYFKTHLQNAKKRLRTLLRNPTKRANAKNLVKLMEIIPDVADSVVPTPLQQAVPPETVESIQTVGKADPEENGMPK
eukprot:scaffold1640_cov161-Amphora_coffeaeformis.AAC.42